MLGNRKGKIIKLLLGSTILSSMFSITMLTIGLLTYFEVQNIKNLLLKREDKTVNFNRGHFQSIH